MVIIKSTEWLKIAYGNGMYVAVGANALDSNIAYSTNGINWTPVDTIVYSIRAIAYGNGRFVAYAMGEHNNASNSDAYIGYSTNGINWTFTKLGYYIDYEKSDIIFAEGKFVACGKSKVVEYSTDGINWNSVTVVNYTMAYNKIIYGNGIYFAYEIKATQVRYAISTTGLNGTWTNGNLYSEKSITNLTDVVFNGEEFVLLATRTIYTTKDFKTFTKISSNLSGRNNGIIYKDGMYVVVGMQSSNSNAYLAYSTNLTEWTEMNPIKDEIGSTITGELNSALIM